MLSQVLFQSPEGVVTWISFSLDMLALFRRKMFFLHSFSLDTISLPPSYWQWTLAFLLGGILEATDIKGSSQHWLRASVFYNISLQACKWKSGGFSTENNLWKFSYVMCIQSSASKNLFLIFQLRKLSLDLYATHRLLRDSPNHVHVKSCVPLRPINVSKYGATALQRLNISLYFCSCCFKLRSKQYSYLKGN